MKTVLTEAAFSKSLCIESQGRRPIAIGAMLVTAWLSTAPVLANGPESQAFKSQTPESLSLRLRFDDGLLSLHANQRPFAEVLGAIQKETGIRFHYTIPMAEVVTLSFKDVPVQEALKRLLGREAQLMFRFPGDRASPAAPGYRRMSGYWVRSRAPSRSERAYGQVSGLNQPASGRGSLPPSRYRP